MSLNSINTNIAAYSAQSNIGRASSSASASIARLSSGNRITKASDDVAALSIGTSLRTSVTTLRTALLNANQGSSLLQVADGALSQISEILQRQKAIATQATSGSVGDAERGFLNQEFQALAQEITRIAETTNFNGVTLLNGGLGTTSSLANTDALAATFVNTASAQTAAGTFVASTTSIQAFNIQTNASLQGTAAGNLQFVDSANNLLTNAAFLNVNTAISGQIEAVKISNVTYGVNAAGSADLSVTIGGVELTGRVTGNGALANIQLTNGNTRLQFSIAANTLNFTNASTANVSEQTFFDNFRFATIQRTQTINGVDFSGTRLEGATGAAATGVAVGRFNSNTVEIKNFAYAGNTGAANTNRITVDINGSTFTAINVNDAINAGNRLVFQNEAAEAFAIDFTGLDVNITNLRTNLQERNEFINALNLGFSRAGTSLDFQVGSTSDDALSVAISSASSNSLYNGQSLEVSSLASAQTAGNALDAAIAKVTSLRADVGALQSRFNFASANIESSIQNQDAARGTLLDTDVSAESTAYATAQVQLQAGIAVLAQANLLPQNLLKLIG